MFYQKCVCLSVVFSVSLVNTAVIGDELFPLDIIHYNDFHSRFEETSVSFPICQSNDTNCLGGFARLFFEIKTLLKEKPDAILLNAGDAFQGTYWYTLLKWNVTQHFLNMLPHDAHTIGNHEFDNGIEGLAPFLAALHAPVVAANIDNSKELALDGLYIPHIVVKRRGKNIGIIGVSTLESKRTSQTGNLIFLDPVKVVKNEARALTKKGVHIIVVLSHCGLDVDKEIARAAGENVDIIVGGHTHSLLWNGPSPSKEPVVGPYPVVVESESKPEHKESSVPQLEVYPDLDHCGFITSCNVLIVQSSALTKYLGNITIYFDSQGELVSYDAGPVFLNRSIPEDQEIKALLQPYTEKLHCLVNEVLGFSNNDYMAKTCGLGECALGNFVIDAFMDSAKLAFPSNFTEVGFIQRNTIRSSLPKGNITRGTIINITPFEDKVISIVISGRHLLEALEMCLSFWWDEDPFQTPFMPSVAGMQVTLNTTSRKVVSVFVNHETSRLPLNLDEDYQFITLNFLYKGGNGFNMFKNYGRDLIIIGKDTDILEKYVRKVTPLNEILDKRLVVIK